MNSQTQTVPTHVGFILDGNRRWAREHGKSAVEGHRQGYENLKTVTRAAMKYGVRYVSAYIFSTENWKRDRTEVRDIMNLLKWALRHEVKSLHKDGIKLRVIGSKAKLGTALLTAIHDAEKLTENNTRGTLLLCLDYGGQQEIVDAVKRIAETGVQPSEITAELIDRFLYAPDVPPPDLIIRTSGEQRLSNFLMWQSAYSELAFTKKNWPEFSELDLERAIKRYSTLQRRFGK